MAKWRERLKRGDGTLASARPGPQPVPRNPLADEVARLTRENTRLHQQLTNAETIIAIQKKVATLLDLLPIPRADEAS
jgi:transposase